MQKGLIPKTVKGSGGKESVFLLRGRCTEERTGVGLEHSMEEGDSILEPYMQKRQKHL